MILAGTAEGAAFVYVDAAGGTFQEAAREGRSEGAELRNSKTPLQPSLFSVWAEWEEGGMKPAPFLLPPLSASEFSELVCFPIVLHT